MKSVDYLILNRIFEERLGLDISLVDFNTDMLSGQFGIEPRDLVYLFFDIEREFNITIPEKDIVSGEFKTLNRMINLIDRQLKKNREETIQNV
ncbi:phosphopantetheine-binding protein [Ruminiclostridium cellobioparum]|jgi:peptide maturation system acyl carrier-related protein|uniref:phosphopantetheine-binding protein n=1 Tax=Ruminiclostridium cellobioparum TaxID=29355 RepID=UPI0005512183|nr:phosphopantetheine-binding protein [Ruminiclostridium cellobioparum]